MARLPENGLLERCGRCVWRCPRRPRSSATASRPGSSARCSCRSPTATTTTASRLVRRAAGAQEARSRPTRPIFVPPYVGGRGWLGVYLDVPVDWDEVADIITDAYRQSPQTHRSPGSTTSH